MANPERGQFEFVAKGQTYQLKLTLDGIAQLEDLYETKYRRPVAFAEVLSRIDAGSISAIRALVWAALRHNHPTVTLQQAGELIDDAGGVLGFASQVGQLLKSSQPDPDDVAAGGDAANPPQAPTRARRVGARSIARRGATA